jgi:hypothetical protein
MKLPAVIGAIVGGGAKIVSTASTLTVVIGAIYLVDCRVSARGLDAIDRCYLSALPMMGLGAGVGGGFMAGYNTFNPALRPQDSQPGTERDENGRFKPRQR